MRAVEAEAGIVFVAAVDLPFLHPAIVARVIRAVGPAVDAAVPVAGGRPQPLAAAYRIGLLPVVAELAGGPTRRMGELLDRTRVAWLDEAALLADPAVAAADPGLAGLRDLDTPADLAGARARAAQLRRENGTGRPASTPVPVLGHQGQRGGTRQGGDRVRGLVRRRREAVRPLDAAPQLRAPGAARHVDRQRRAAPPVLGRAQHRPPQHVQRDRGGDRVPREPQHDLVAADADHRRADGGGANPRDDLLHPEPLQGGPNVVVGPAADAAVGDQHVRAHVALGRRATPRRARPSAPGGRRP